MHNFLTEVTADCTDILVVKPQKVMPNPGRKNQIVHTFEDGRNAVVAVSNTSIFEVELQWTYVSEADRSTIFELFHASAKANGSARSFCWLNPVDGYVYTVRFLTPLRTVYKPGSLRSVETVRLRVLGYLTDTEYIIDLGDLHLATVDNGAMFFHDTEDFSVYVGASGNTPFKIVFTDSGGLTAEAWCGEIGGGLADGGELVTNGDMEASPVADDYSTVSANISDEAVIVNSGAQSMKITATDNNGRAFQLINATPKALYEIQMSSTNVAGDKSRYTIGDWGGVGNFYADAYADKSAGWDTLTHYLTSLNLGFVLRVECQALGYIAYTDDWSVKQVTDIPATGLKLYSTQDGTTQSMGTTDAGFNPNTIEKVDIYG